jgi:hypothetical protein
MKVQMLRAPDMRSVLPEPVRLFAHRTNDPVDTTDSPDVSRLPF